MKTIVEKPKEVPVFADADVIVVGGGPAGIGAALAAARIGAKTILLETSNCLGGMQTQCMNPRFAGVDPDIVGGIILDIINRLKKYDAIFDIAREKSDVDPFLGPVYTFDAESYKYLLDEMMEEAGVEIFYHALAVSAVKEENAIKGVIIESKEGRHAILGKVVIDSTGSGDIVWKSGIKCMPVGFPDGPQKGRHMGFSYGFNIRGVDLDRFEAFRQEHPEEWGSLTCGAELVKKARAEGKLYGNRSAFPIGNLDTGTISMMGPYYGLRLGHHGWLLKDLSDGERDCRKQAWSAYTLLKNNVPGFENSHIEQTPTHLFLRDMHRILGEYVLKEEDIRLGKAFDDSITVSNALPDVFGPDHQHKLYGDVPPFDIPYRCLLPQETDNLLTAGSTISADLITYAAVRYCTPSVCTGQAAGTAAALAARNNVTPRKLDVKLVQATLRKEGIPISVQDLSKAVLNRYGEKIEFRKKNLMLLEPD
ncbi:MAG: FAD-dependent oxidoreductase [Deltaproteobacteria bacterium]|nr:FAD-dependent oxidoreductase [Deltaproteobacteria bacterium]